MAIRHINPHAKAVSGWIVSGEDADKVFSMLFGKRDKEEIQKKKERLRSHIAKSIQNAKKSSK